jgi:hypothetical protein
MANTFVKISTVTVGSGGAASIDFTSIPQTYTDLKIVISAREDNAGGGGGTCYIQFNGDTGNNYSWRRLNGNGSTASSSNGSSVAQLDVAIQGVSTATASVFGSGEIYIPNYTSSNYKSVSADSLYENNATANNMRLGAGLWSSASAITSIKVYPIPSGVWVQYSTATLYGIKNT